MDGSHFQLAVFDISGTTVKDNGNITQSFLFALKKFGYTVELKEVNRVRGYNKQLAIRMLLERCYPGEINANNGLVKSIHDLFLERMASLYQNDPHLEPLAYAEIVFSHLHKEGAKVALNTGFPKSITNIIMERLNWREAGLVDHVISSDEVEKGRPAPDMIQAIMHKLGVLDTSTVAKIGDTEVDTLEGRMAGCGLVVGVSTGVYTNSQLESYYPDAVIDDLSELLFILNSASFAK